MGTPSGTSSRDQAANKRAAKRAAGYLAQVVASIGVGGKDGLADLGIEVTNRVKTLLSSAGTGRLYRVTSGPTAVRNLKGQYKKRGGYHRASAPGMPPAVDTGLLRSKYTWQLGEDRKGHYVEVGTNVKYAPWLEFGTRHMKPRPHLRVAINQVRSQIASLIVAGIVKEQTEVVRRLPKEVRAA